MLETICVIIRFSNAFLSVCEIDLLKFAKLQNEFNVIIITTKINIIKIKLFREKYLFEICNLILKKKKDI